MEGHLSHKKGQKGFSEAMANELNRHQAAKVQRKMTSTKIHKSKPKQGYTPSRPSLDNNTLG